MPKHTKSKARLDKWYRIAKEQGYRSRAAFKLIQLNRKYNFLNNANILVDLCAAPGGWLQVATRYMPVSSIKIGIDLVSIKHVPGCITFQEDITTPRCLALIKKEIKSEKVDVVLNDGAPNVGANWNKDAYSQIELVLASLKLAATVLKKGGTFVTKVFRSVDYNSLMWVLNKFFEKVEASKPAASRTQSAEIFIVCLRYIMPDYIDPKLFDAKFVFQDTEEDILKESNEGFNSIDDVLAKAKRRHRTGYDSDAPISLHKTITFEDFLNIENPLNVFAGYNRISFTKEDEEKYLPLAKTPEDYKEIIEDLKVQGKREFQSLLKWRNKVLRALGKQNKKKGKEEGMEEEVKEDGNEEDGNGTDDELEAEIEKEKRREMIALKREKEKKLGKIVKLKSLAPQPVTTAEEIEFDFTKKKGIEKLGFVEVDDDDMIVEPAPKKKAASNRDVEDNIELWYELKKNAAAREEATRLRRIEEKRRKKYGDEEVDEENLQLETIERNTGLEIEEVPEEKPKKNNGRVSSRREMEEEENDEDYEDLSDSDDDDDDDLVQEKRANEKKVAEKYLNKSKWFDKDIFKQGIQAEKLNGLTTLKNPIKMGKLKDKIDVENVEKNHKEKNDDDDFEDLDDEEDKKQKANKKKKDKLKINPSMKGAEKRKRKIQQDALNDLEKMEEEFGDKIEVVPELRYDDYDEDTLAEMRSLATRMLRKKDREEIIEDSYNRYARPVDEDAPAWFIEDENQHNHKILPITKAEYQAEKQRLLEIKNRPIKKIVEAKIRRKFQVQKKLKKAENRAKDIMEQEGVSEVSKLKQVKSLYKKAMASKKEEKKYIVAKSFNGKAKGNRKTGRTTRMVDSRMKKDKRAQKRIEKNGGRKGDKGRGGGGKRKSKTRQIKRH